MSIARAHIRRSVILSGQAWRSWCGKRMTHGEEAARIEQATCEGCMGSLMASLERGPPSEPSDDKRARTAIRLESLRRKKRKAREA